VRNPLHSIGLETEIALEEISKAPSPRNAQIKQSLQSIQASVDRLGRLTENYLKLSRLSSGKSEGFDVDAVMEEVLATYAPACEASGIRVEWSREKGASFRIVGDRHLFEQALGNLFRNAIQAVESSQRTDGRIEWKLGNTEAGRAWILIHDNGPGVPDEVRKRLFAPFLTTKAQGTGLGLSFVKQVIDNHGGEIRLAEGGDGACFEILLALQREDEQTVPEVTL
jgi:signal transduction histidine kinase